MGPIRGAEQGVELGLHPLRTVRVSVLDVHGNTPGTLRVSLHLSGDLSKEEVPMPFTHTHARADGAGVSEVEVPNIERFTVQLRETNKLGQLTGRFAILSVGDGLDFPKCMKWF